MSKPKKSLQPSYFDDLYRANPDPWNFETSDYETEKYQTTIAALPKSRYLNALEIGGSIGVLTAKLAPHCNSLLSIDVSPIAQQKAIARCQHLPHVRFEIAQVPQVYPEGMFDLTLVSEVGYYLSWDDLKLARQLIIDRLVVGGHLLLVHWTLFAKNYPLTGDEVHDYFGQLNNTQLKRLQGSRQERYRLDLFERI
jgi:hypothetical protein